MLKVLKTGSVVFLFFVHLASTSFAGRDRLASMNDKQRAIIGELAEKCLSERENDVDAVISLFPFLIGESKRRAVSLFSKQRRLLPLDLALQNLPENANERIEILTRVQQNLLALERGSLLFRSTHGIFNYLEEKKEIPIGSSTRIFSSLRIRQNVDISYTYYRWLREAKNVFPSGDPIFFAPFRNPEIYPESFELTLRHSEVLGDSQLDYLFKFVKSSELMVRYSVAVSAGRLTSIQWPLVKILMSDADDVVGRALVSSLIDSYDWEASHYKLEPVLLELLQVGRPGIDREVFSALTQRRRASSASIKPEIETLLLKLAPYATVSSQSWMVERSSLMSPELIRFYAENGATDYVRQGAKDAESFLAFAP